MSKQLPDVVAEFNAAVRRVENFQSIARARELQIKALDDLSAALSIVGDEKTKAVADGNEDYANMLLGCQCVGAALGAELRMWLLLKEEEPEEAWDQLVTAQMASVDAVRAHPGFAHVGRNVERLEALEKLVFPPQVFMSAGMTVGHYECSICGEDYDECDHLIARPYMGELCFVKAREITADHVAIVAEPADKRCRVVSFDTEEGRRNRMTWRLQSLAPLA